MIRRKALLVSLLFLLIFAAVVGMNGIYSLSELRVVLGDIASPWVRGVIRDRRIWVVMRDGVRLRTELLLPVSAETRVPTILIRTPYGVFTYEWQRVFVDHGFAVVVQHVRGRHGSEGEHFPYRHAANDGFDTISWIVEQPWASDSVGTFGCSYLGESQMVLATANHPNHKAMVAEGAGGGIGSASGSFGYFGIFENGVLNLASAVGWSVGSGATSENVTQPPADWNKGLKEHLYTLPVNNIVPSLVAYPTVLEQYLSHKLNDPWWGDQGFVDQGDTFTVPGLHLSSWFDQTVGDSIKLANIMNQNSRGESAGQQHVLLGPGHHCSLENQDGDILQVGDYRVEKADPNLVPTVLNWFDYWLKGQPRELPPRFRFHILGASRWEESNEWPPGNSEKYQLFLAGKDGDKRLSRQPGENGSVTYAYDPNDPVPTIGGPFCCTGPDTDKPGIFDQRRLSKRSDVMVFSSSPLEDEIVMADSAILTLFVATDRPDTDFTAKMVDIAPDGQHWNLQDGVVRLRYRDGVERAKLAEPGRVYPVAINFRPIAYRFKKGHRVGLHLSSSNFPRLARNLNTGGPEYLEETPVEAINTIYFGEKTPSALTFFALRPEGG